MTPAGRPRIGVSAVPRDVPTGYGGDRADTIAVGMTDGVAGAGGVPLMLPVVSPELAAAQLEPLHGLVLAGGQDLDLPELALPHADRWIDPRRDRHELALWAEARRRRLPVLGICRGLQLANVAAGGTLNAHVDGHDAGDEHAERLHPVEVEPGTTLAELLDEDVSLVNTIHHQTLCDLGEGFVASARASDGTIEAAEIADDGPWFVGVQWHPELILDRPGGHRLFEGVVRAALHRRVAASA